MLSLLILIIGCKKVESPQKEIIDQISQDSAPISGIVLTFDDNYTSSLKVYKEAILKAKSIGGILVLIEHRPLLKPNKNNSFTYVMLDSICSFAAQQNLRFYKMQDI